MNKEGTVFVIRFYFPNFQIDKQATSCIYSAEIAVN